MILKITVKRTVIFLFAMAFLGSCGDDILEPDRTTPLKSITVDLNNTYQSITGFGGCNSVFRGASNFPKEDDIQKAYGNGADELGLTIFRVSIPPNASNWSAIAEVAKFAQNREAIVFASPWDAPSDMLDPEHNEKRILPSKYSEYVNHLNAFDDFMQNEGVNLHAISMQNEPDIGEWTQWTAFEVADFMQNYADGINNNVITAESFNFNRSYYDGILNDPVAVNNFEIVGGHIYGNGLGAYPLAEQKGKEIWMTEYLLNEFTDNITTDDWTTLTDEQIWDQSMEMLITIHEAMISNWNAYIWWYLKRYYSFIGDGIEGSADGEILKRGYAFSHYSKYVRPGYIRVNVQHQDLSDIQVTAYKGDGKVVLQIINPTSSFTSKFNIDIASTEAISVEGYVTDLNANRENYDIEIDNEGQVVVQARAKSITTVIIEI